jgi:MurNAc alpha-1-phosphate uridylyltransferase|tara:strand:+ start:519 stop:1208 length:690 start_codon:yes stop_codon:yes gene_type:complete
MKAIILSAGYGKRLQPLTKDCPKSLLKINNETLLSNSINFLSLYGIKEIIINVHYLANQIIDYVDKNNFNLAIKIINEEKEILNTGGGILNAIKFFSNEHFLVINPDTVWNSAYIKELKLMEKEFISKKQKCNMLVVNKEKSFDKGFKGDFNLENNLINKKNKNNLKYIYTGLQIIKPEVFSNLTDKVFSINKIWDKLISQNELNAVESNINFFHVSTLDIYNDLLKKF